MKEIGKFKIRKIEKRNSKKEFEKHQVQMIRQFFLRLSGKIHCVLICSMICLMIFSGCGESVSILKNGAMEDSSQTEDRTNLDVKQEATNQDTQTDKNNEDTEKPQDENLNNDVSQDTAHLIYVDLCGAVKNPGVYSLAQGSRVFEVIALAGGFTKDAYTKAVNQAKTLEDGEQIYIYTKQEAEKLLAQGVLLDADKTTGNETSATEHVSGGKVNLNLADKETLMTLTGIGSTRADAILQYRTTHGKFSKIEELMNVEGIKEKTYEKIKDCITV